MPNISGRAVGGAGTDVALEKMSDERNRFHTMSNIFRIPPCLTFWKGDTLDMEYVGHA